MNFDVVCSGASIQWAIIRNEVAKRKWCAMNLHPLHPSCTYKIITSTKDGCCALAGGATNIQSTNACVRNARTHTHKRYVSAVSATMADI